MDIHRVNAEPAKLQKRSIKRAVISAAAAFGIKPVGRTWITAFSSLNGSFERTGWELSFYVATLVFIAAIITLFASIGIRDYRHTGWNSGVEFALIYCLAMSCLLVYLVSRSGLRYVFAAGTINAYNTWGRMLWSEDLTGLRDVSFFTARGETAMTLFWAERKRRMVLLNSLRIAIDTSLASVERSKAQSSSDITEDVGPSWICPYCHESNPGNFEECWKCQKDRPTEVKS
jgi:hypothetical protein